VDKQGHFLINMLWRIMEEQTKLDAFFFAEYIYKIVHFVGHPCRLRCTWIGQHTLQIGDRVTFKNHSRLLMNQIAYRGTIEMCLVHGLEKLDFLGTQIFDADGNLRSFDLMMITVVAITVVGFDAKSDML
jgi:hypothetical protein